MSRGIRTGKTPVARRAAQAGALLFGALLFVGPLTATSASAAPTAPSFNAVGSAEQVYVTGLAPYARMSLLNAKGQDPLHTRCRLARWSAVSERATGQGLPRAPESRTEQKSGALTVHADRGGAVGSGRSTTNRFLDNGYGYLTTRDGTKLAIDVHPPTSPAGEPGLPAGHAASERPRLRCRRTRP